MPFLAPGLQRVWEIVAGASEDQLVAGHVDLAGVQKPITAESLATVVDGDRVACRVELTFASDEANADWRGVTVVTRDGVTVYEDDEDRGRKAPGSEWVLELNLWLTGE